MIRFRKLLFSDLELRGYSTLRR